LCFGITCRSDCVEVLVDRGVEMSVIKSFGAFGGEIDWRIWRIC
jgi:hypothetical protein